MAPEAYRGLREELERQVRSRLRGDQRPPLDPARGLDSTARFAPLLWEHGPLAVGRGDILAPRNASSHRQRTAAEPSRRHAPLAVSASPAALSAISGATDPQRESGRRTARRRGSVSQFRPEASGLLRCPRSI